MKADFELIRSITHGAARVVEEDGGILFHRFTEEQRETYESNHEFWLKTFADSGIRLEFVTDAASFALRGSVEPASSREFYFFDVYVNGALVRHVGSHSHANAPEFGFEVALPEGTSRVAVYLPGLSKIKLRELEFTGASKVVPVPKKRTIICYGDSITQGYDAKYPSLTYGTRLAAEFDAELRNKGIGCDTFRAEVLAAPEAERRPDFIVVAFGTNDWGLSTAELFRRRASEFFAKLAELHPGVPVAALTPIWRADWDHRARAGTFADAAQIVAEAAKRDPDAVVLPGMKLVPPITEFFADARLHPNDLGFTFYARNLIRELRAAGLPRPR